MAKTDQTKEINKKTEKLYHLSSVYLDYQKY